MKNKYLLLLLLAIIAAIALVYAYQKNCAKEERITYELDMEQQQDQKIDTGMQAAEEVVEQTEEQMSYIDVSVVEAKKMIDQNPEIIIIDVSPNYADGHLPEAVSYYVGDGSLDRAIPNLDKSEAYLVYCHVDSASISGAQKLIDAGFKNVYRLEGNYKAWVDAGYPIEK